MDNNSQFSAYDKLKQLGEPTASFERNRRKQVKDGAKASALLILGTILMLIIVLVGAEEGQPWRATVPGLLCGAPFIIVGLLAVWLYWRLLNTNLQV